MEKNVLALGENFPLPGKPTVALYVCLVLLPLLGISQTTQPTFWYNDEAKVICYYQPDVYAFRCKNGEAYPGTYDPSLIASFRYRGHRADKCNEVIFYPGVTEVEKRAEISKIRRHTSFAWDYAVVVHDSTLSAEDDKWYILDDIIMVNFKGEPSETTIDAFAARHQLNRYIDPPLHLPGPKTYMFKIQHDVPGELCICWNGAMDCRPDTSHVGLLSQGGFVGGCDR